MTNDKSVDWDVWRNVPELPLWEAVALSLNIEPRTIPFNGSFWLSGQKIEGVAPEFEDRLLVAERNRGAGKLPSPNRKYGTLVLTPVNIGVFAAWALQITPPWDMPEYLVEIAKNAPSESSPPLDPSSVATPAPDKPLGTRERETLLKLVIGMAVKGYSYDPGARRNSAVSDISGDLEQLGISVSEDTVRKYLDEASKLLPPQPDKPGQ